VVLAPDEVWMLGHIGAERILLGAIHEGESAVAKAPEPLGISFEVVRQQVGEIVGQGRQAPIGHVPASQGGRRARVNFVLSRR
jgi:ATP-dependent Clp protease ATP-binding subunit ClpC